MKQKNTCRKRKVITQNNKVNRFNLRKVKMMKYHLKKKIKLEIGKMIFQFKKMLFKTSEKIRNYLFPLNNNQRKYLRKM